MGERDELWHWAPKAANQQVRKQRWGADYTLSEMQAGIENVKTGLRRELVEPASDSEDTADDGEDGADDEAEVDEDAEEEGEEEEEDEDKMEVVDVQQKADGLERGASSRLTVPQMPLDHIFRFMMTGSSGGIAG